MDKPLILVTGKDGQLGFELQQIQHFISSKFEFIFAGRNEMDLMNPFSISSFILEKKPQYLINCAAYTAVDKAEQEEEIAFKINAEAPALMAEVCKKINCQFIHISTDYVFDGTKKTPYLTIDAKNSLNVYGHSKAKGEELLVEKNPQSIIIRTSWVYSSHGKNFVKTMLKLMSDKDEINVVDDQFGNPTYASDLAEAILEIILKLNNFKGYKHQSIYHYTNTGNISWYQFAKAIQNNASLNCKVNAVPSSSYPTPAKRSNYSVLNCDDIIHDFNLTQRDWEESLRICLSKLSY